MRNTNKLKCFLLLPFLFASCIHFSYVGTFTYRGAPKWEIYYYLQLKSDSTFVFHYVLGGNGISSTGVWHSKGRKVFLNSNVQNTTNFGLQVKSKKKNEDSEKLFITVENMNWRYYNWHCVLNDDTILVESDTLFWEETRIPCDLFFYVTPLTPIQEHKLPFPKNSFAFSALRQTFAQSEKIKISSGGFYTISCDSVFGKEPLHYVNLQGEKYNRESFKCLRDVKSGFLLSPDTLNQDGYLYNFELWRNDAYVDQ